MNDKTILVRGFRLLSILHSMAELSRLYFQFFTFPTHGCLGAWSLCASRLPTGSSTSLIHQVTSRGSNAHHSPAPEMGVFPVFV